jgi:hypothetical protein
MTDKNLAKYLNLPDYIVDIVENVKHTIDYDFLVRMYEEKTDYNMLIKNISYLCDDINNILPYDIIKKFILLVFLFKYIDKSYDIIIEKGREEKYVERMKNFKIVINYKIIELKVKYSEYVVESMNHPSGNILLYQIFYSYLNENLVSNKRFTFVEKNKIYRKRIFRNYILILSRFNSLYKYILEKRYAPGSAWFLQAQTHFDIKRLEMTSDDL